MAKTKRGSTPPPKNQRSRRKAPPAVGKGTPAKPRRVMMALRVTPALHDEILRRAEETGRSITQEMELLLEHALVSEKSMGSKAWRIGLTVTRNLLNAIDDAVEENPLLFWDSFAVEPLDDPDFLREGLIRSITLLAKMAPDKDIDGLFADARERIEDRSGHSGAPGATHRKMAG